MADTQVLITGTLNYIDMLPTNEYYKGLSDDEKAKFVFAASEEIKRFYPTVTLEPSMVAMQVMYNVEGEMEGTAMMRRQNIQEYSVKDVTAKLTKAALSPDLIEWLDRLLEDEMTAKDTGGFGWLI